MTFGRSKPLDKRPKPQVDPHERRLQTIRLGKKAKVTLATVGKKDEDAK